MVLVELYKLHLFHFPQRTDYIKTIETGRNPFGLCELSNDTSWELLVYPGRQTGAVQVGNILGHFNVHFMA